MTQKPKEVFVLGYTTHEEIIEAIVQALRRWYVVPPAQMASDARFFTDWADTIREFAAAVFVGVRVDEEVLQRLESYENPIVLAVSSFDQAHERLGGVENWSLVNIDSATLTEDVVDALGLAFGEID